MELFWGISNPFASSAQKQFDEIVRTYGARPNTPERMTADAIWTAMKISPDLERRMLEAVGQGHLQSITPKTDEEGAAEYSVRHLRIGIEGGFREDRQADMNELIFTLGHEIEHARSARGRDYVDRTLVPGLERIALAPAGEQGTRDYTPVVHDFVQHVRADEGRAHLGGFNALASYVRTHYNESPEHMLRDLYEIHPQRMGDFIDKTGPGPVHTYAFKEGLHPAKDFSLPTNDARNIEAMKGYYADRAQLGDERMNYATKSTRDALKFIDIYEKAGHEQEHIAWLKRDAEEILPGRAYRVDFATIGADAAALGKPQDGIVVVREAISPQSLDLPPIQVLDLGSLLSEAPLPQPAAQHAQAEEPPLFRQTLDALARMPAPPASDDPEARRNIAASLAQEARNQGLESVDHVVPGNEGRIIAYEGDTHLQSTKTAWVFVAEARQQSAEAILDGWAIQPAVPHGAQPSSSMPDPAPRTEHPLKL